MALTSRSAQNTLYLKAISAARQPAGGGGVLPACPNAGRSPACLPVGWPAGRPAAHSDVRWVIHIRVSIRQWLGTIRDSPGTPLEKKTDTRKPRTVNRERTPERVSRKVAKPPSDPNPPDR